MPLLTEAEAKVKWCPQARVRTYTASNSMGTCGSVPTNACSANRTIKGLMPESYCLGSGCMYWRWGGPPHRADHGRRFAEIKETPDFLNAEIERLSEDEFDVLLESLTKKYTENPLPRPDDIPESWKYLVSFEEWYEEGCVMWLESDETAKPRAEAKRRGYCGLAGKPEE